MDVRRNMTRRCLGTKKKTWVVVGEAGTRGAQKLMTDSVSYLPAINNQLNKIAEALFRWKKILDFATIALSFVCGKYCPIMDY